MTTTTTPNNVNTQETFPILETITKLIRKIVNKRPGIYYGNLEFWIRDKLPEANRINIKMALLQLIHEESYFLSYEQSVYPPNKVDDNVRTLTRFVSMNKLSFTDYGILYELYKTKEGFKRLSDFSRKVVSQCWSEDEHETKIRIQLLLLKNILAEKDGSLQINWGLIREAAT